MKQLLRSTSLVVILGLANSPALRAEEPHGNGQALRGAGGAYTSPYQRPPAVPATSSGFRLKAGGEGFGASPSRTRTAEKYFVGGSATNPPVATPSVMPMTGLGTAYSPSFWGAGSVLGGLGCSSYPSLLGGGSLGYGALGYGLGGYGGYGASVLGGYGSLSYGSLSYGTLGYGSLGYGLGGYGTSGYGLGGYGLGGYGLGGYGLGGYGLGGYGLGGYGLGYSPSLGGGYGYGYPSYGYGYSPYGSLYGAGYGATGLGFNLGIGMSLGL